jgi:hypothetical protein
LYRSPSPSKVAQSPGEGPMTPSTVMWVEMISFPMGTSTVGARPVAGPSETYEAQASL